MTRDQVINIVERSVATFIQAFLAVFVVSDMSSAKEAAVAGVAAALSVLKNAVSSYLEDR